MNYKLNNEQDWRELARQANWSVANLANQLAVSRRTLHRHFLEKLEQTPKTWLAKSRQKLALELLLNGFSVKETAAQLGYEYTETFSRKFKKRAGCCPIEFARNSKSYCCPIKS